MPPAHERHRKTIESYTLAIATVEKRIPVFNKKLDAYPAVRKSLFPQAEGDRAYRELTPSVRSFETAIPQVIKVMQSLLKQSGSYLRMLTQDHLPIGEYVRLISQDANQAVLLGAVSNVLLEDTLDTLSTASDEALLAARCAPSAYLVHADTFASYGIEMADLRSDLRKLRKAIEQAQRAYVQDPAHDALCPNCLAKAVCEAANLN